MLDTNELNQPKHPVRGHGVQVLIDKAENYTLQSKFQSTIQE